MPDTSLALSSAVSRKGRKVNKKLVFKLLVSVILISTLAPRLNLQLIRAAPATIVVPDEYTTIHETIGSASDGDTYRSTLVRDYWPTTAWRYSTPEEQEMNSTKLEEMMEYVRNERLKLDSVVIVRNGYIILEEYPGAIYRQNYTHNLYSATKSVSSMLIGIAIEEGYIDNVQHRLVDFFPGRSIANMDSRKQAITLEHLLTMSSGLQWDEWTYPLGDSRNSMTRMLNSGNWVQFVLDQPMAYESGTVWAYNGGGSHLLSAIIRETTGTDAQTYAREHLFNPLGITRWYWESDYQGLTYGFSHLFLRPLDMAKLGFLYLNKGSWDGEQIVPAEWVDASTESRFSVFPDVEYGYQWWMHPSIGLYWAWGMAGQRIAVVPDYDMVVVFTGSFYTDGDPGDYLINEYILPAATEGIYVVVPDDFPTIQEAINNVTEGGTVFVRAGTYYEHVVVNKTISLVGEDSSTTIIDGSGIGHVVIITDDDVSMTGFTVQNSGTAYHITGINLNNVNYCNISGNIITNNEHGLEVHNSSYYNTISGNNMIENNKWGMHVIDSHYNNVSGNIIRGSIWGSIAIHGFSTHNRIFENNVGNNDNVGISIDGSEYNSIYGNNITNNLWGISVQYSARYNTVSRNNIANNDYSIKLESNTYANTFYHNNLVNNTFQTSIIGYNYANSWDDGYPSGGNYWSDYSGVDSNHDGIGDTHYIIDLNNRDRYPLMGPWPIHVRMHTLAIDSSPSGVSFMVDGVSHASPWSGTYYESALVNLEVPEMHSIGQARYYWSQWSDGVINRSRMVTVDTNITLTANYTGPYYELTVTSSHITGVTFTINGVPKTTPYTEWLLEDFYRLEMPKTYNGYVWSHWLEDGDTNRIKTIILSGTTWTGIFVPAPPPPSKPVGGYSVAIDGYVVTKPLAPYSALIAILAISFAAIKRKTKRIAK